MEESPRLSHNWLTITMLVANFFYGAGFILGFTGPWVTQSSLYQSMHGVDTSIPLFWGAFLVTAVLFALSPIARKLSRTIGATLGVLAWIFASFIYAQTGYLLVLVTVSMVYLSFWLYFYMRFVTFNKRF